MGHTLPHVIYWDNVEILEFGQKVVHYVCMIILSLLSLLHTACTCGLVTILLFVVCFNVICCKTTSIAPTSHGSFLLKWQYNFLSVTFFLHSILVQKKLQSIFVFPLIPTWLIISIGFLFLLKFTVQISPLLNLYLGDLSVLT